MPKSPSSYKGVEGSNPVRPLHFNACKLGDVARFVVEHHYSKSHPGGVDYAFRADFDEYLCGVALFGWMAGNPKAVHHPAITVHEQRELMRVVLLDEVPKNSETKFIGWCLRWLRKNTKLRLIISFADPAHGHTGIIYRAGNWEYVGLQKPDRPRMIIDGKEVHPKSAYNRYGTSSADVIWWLGHTVELRYREPKHKYLYFLDKTLAPNTAR